MSTHDLAALGAELQAALCTVCVWPADLVDAVRAITRSDDPTRRLSLQLQTRLAGEPIDLDVVDWSVLDDRLAWLAGCIDACRARVGSTVAAVFDEPVSDIFWL